MPTHNKAYEGTPGEVESDRKGKEVCVDLLGQEGWVRLESPEGFSSHDLVMERGGEVILVEAEYRDDSWRGGNFPYNTMTVPQRKYRSQSKLYVQCSGDQRMAGVVDMALVQSCKIIDKMVMNKSTGERNKEWFFNVPKHEVRFYRKSACGRWVAASL